MSTDMIETTPTYNVNTEDASQLNFAITLTSEWVIPAFLADEQKAGSITLTPVLEVLCVRLRYPTHTMTPVSGLDMSVSDMEVTYLKTDQASFSGIAAGEASIVRAVAGGSAIYSDDAVAGHHGSILAQMDLSVLPSATLPASAEIQFSIPAVEINTDVYSFTPASGDLKCLHIPTLLLSSCPCVIATTPTTWMETM
jgi:hypothetical protein